MGEEALIVACGREVDELHRFFTGWLGGRLAADDATFARVESVLAPEFVIVTPDGRRSERAELLRGLRAAHGRRTGLRIWVERFAGRAVADDLLLATYEEWQEEAGATRGRRSTALFRRAVELPQGVRWLHVHETWIEAAPEPHRP